MNSQMRTSNQKFWNLLNLCWWISGRRGAGPCRHLMPTVEQLAGEYAGRVKIGKVNTDDNHQTAAGYGITSIPTVMLFRNGEMVDKVVGAPAKQHFVNMLDKVLA